MAGSRRLSSGALRDLSFRLIILLGVVSLCGSLVSNGARSVTGPYLDLLGAGAAVVGLVAGLGEFVGYALRFATGVYVDQSRHYWTMALIGYGLLAAIPLLALVGRWEAAALLIILERIGKAIRTPARDTMLSHATTTIGRGWGFGVHKALDQIGAIIGPVTLAAAVYLTGGYGYGFLILGIPLVFLFITLIAARAAVPKPRRLEAARTLPAPDHTAGEIPDLLPYATFIFLGMAGFANFPLISYHLTAETILPDAGIPLLYAVAMVISVIVALATGRVYDRFGARTLIVIPVISTLTAILAFAPGPDPVIAGALIWGSGIGIYETAIRATIADTTGIDRRGQAYGVLNAVFGTAWFMGSVVMGVLYEISVGHIIGYVLFVEILAVIAYIWMYRAKRVYARPT